MSNILAIAHKELQARTSRRRSPTSSSASSPLMFGYLLRRRRCSSSNAEHADGQGGGPAGERQRAADPAGVPQLDRRLPVRAADDHDAHLLGGEALGHDRAAADVAAHRLPDHHGQVPRRDGSLRRDARRHAAVTWALLFCFGNPEWKPIVTTYLGLLLMGGCFISVGLLISSLTKNQIVAGMVTFARVPDAVGDQLDRAVHAGRRRRRSSTTCRSPVTSTTSRAACSTPSTWSTTSASSRSGCS